MRPRRPSSDEHRSSTPRTQKINYGLVRHSYLTPSSSIHTFVSFLSSSLPSFLTSFCDSFFRFSFLSFFIDSDESHCYVKKEENDRRIANANANQPTGDGLDFVSISTRRHANTTHTFHLHHSICTTTSSSSSSCSCCCLCCCYFCWLFWFFGEHEKWNESDGDGLWCNSGSHPILLRLTLSFPKWHDSRRQTSNRHRTSKWY